MPGATHAALDAFGMLVVMRVEAGEPYYHGAGRWVPGLKGERKEYGLTMAYGPDFSPQNTLEGNPARAAEIVAARQAGAATQQAPRTLPGGASGPMPAPSIADIQADPDRYQKPQEGPVTIDGADTMGPHDRSHFGTTGELGNHFTPPALPQDTPTADAPPTPVVQPPQQEIAVATGSPELWASPGSTPIGESPAEAIGAVRELAESIMGSALAYALIHGPVEKYLEIHQQCDQLRERLK